MDQQADPQSSPTIKSSDTIVALHNTSKIIGIVQDINTDGTLQQTTCFRTQPDQDRNQDHNCIFKIEQSENAFTQFYTNFYDQLKNPEDYSFFKVTEYDNLIWR